jgi:hypothetical protein
LLPKESMHFVISTFSLHWMSQVNWLMFNYSTILIQCFASWRLLAHVHRTV